MKLNEQHHRAVDLLIQGCSGKETAVILGVTPESVSTWRNDPDFQAAINSQLKDNHAATQEKLRSLATFALATIEAVMHDPKAPARDRVAAAFKVLELVNVKLSAIGSTNPGALRRDADFTDLMDNLM